jgi:hypothetical protein
MNKTQHHLKELENTVFKYFITLVVSVHQQEYSNLEKTFIIIINLILSYLLVDFSTINLFPFPPKTISSIFWGEISHSLPAVTF